VAIVGGSMTLEDLVARRFDHGRCSRRGRCTNEDGLYALVPMLTPAASGASLGAL